MTIIFGIPIKGKLGHYFETEEEILPLFISHIDGLLILFCA